MMHPARTRDRIPWVASTAAFTLIEAMLAIVIFAGVLAAIYSSWTAILRGSRVGLTAAAEAQRLRVAIGALEDAITGAQMVPANARHYAFIAEADRDESSLSFVARLPESFPRGGRYGDFAVRRVTFTAIPERGGGLTLLLRQTPLLLYPEGDVDEEENPLVLARDLATIQFEYWGSPSGEWEPEWVSTNQLPQLIRFTLAFNRAGAQQADPSQIVSRVVPLPASGQNRALGGTTQRNPDVQGTNDAAPPRRGVLPDRSGRGAVR
jgi:type II secretory pathway pseudopilin PulG